MSRFGASPTGLRSTINKHNPLQCSVHKQLPVPSMLLIALIIGMAIVPQLVLYFLHTYR